jgi:hypothetical protein
MGAMKYRSSVTPESSAANSAGQRPPTTATTTTSSWNSSTVPAMPSSVRCPASSQVSSGPTTAASTKPVSTRDRESAPPSFGSDQPRPAAECVTMCTSSWPDSRITVAPMPGPVTSDPSRPRRLTPITSWEASAPLAKSTSALGTSDPTTWW